MRCLEVLDLIVYDYPFVQATAGGDKPAACSKTVNESTITNSRLANASIQVTICTPNLARHAIAELRCLYGTCGVLTQNCTPDHALQTQLNKISEDRYLLSEDKKLLDAMTAKMDHYRKKLNAERSSVCVAAASTVGI